MLEMHEWALEAAQPSETRNPSKVQNGQEAGLTVHVEVNLPPACGADTYDATEVELSGFDHGVSG